MSDLPAILLTLKLALVSSVILMSLGLPLAWWMAKPVTSRIKRRTLPLVEAIIALPLVLPPTVLGFYLLILFSPDHWLGASWIKLTGNTLAFSFTGLVIGSIVYSLPFVVQPLQATFSAISPSLIEQGQTLGASPWQKLTRIILPLSKNGIISAFSLGFAHTLGEFGVVLMIGGNIPGETRVVSIAIYDHVETLQFTNAHQLSLVLVLFSISLLFWLYWQKRTNSQKAPLGIS